MRVTLARERLAGAGPSRGRPPAWRDWAPPPEAWQHLKELWHVLVRFGRPAKNQEA